MDALLIMKWPLIACLALPALLVYYGLHIIRREIIFVDLALAQVAALGVCVAILLEYHSHDWQTYAWSVSFTMVGAAIFTLTRTRERRVPQEALIGIVYVVAAATGILLLSRSAEGNEVLRRTLVGDVLLVRPWQVGKAFALYAVIGLVHYIFRRQFLLVSFEPEKAMLEGVSLRRWDFLFYALFGLVVTSFVQVGGVLLVFSYLIIPAVCANLLADTLAVRLVAGLGTAIVGGGLGLYGSYRLDLPTGAAIVCGLGLTLLMVGAVVGTVFRKPAGRWPADVDRKERSE